MKIRVGLIIGYNGDGFSGIQYNKNLKTIESAILSILLETKCITELNSIDPSKIDMKSTSRTDKGVHASFNLVTCKIQREINNELLLELKSKLILFNIILYKIVKLPKKFIGYKTARSRIYKYYIPTYFISEVFLKLKNTFDKYINVNNKCITDNNINNECIQNDTCVQSDIKESMDNSIDECNNALIPLIENYKIDEDKLKSFNLILQKFIGLKSFHNFTINKTEGTPNRQIYKINLGNPFIVNKIEYVEVKIHGASFLLHQIRKMMAYSVIISINKQNIFASNENVFDKLVKISIPKAPAEYLFLSNILFNDYNNRVDEDHGKIEIDLEEQLKFEKEYIYPSIFKIENLREWIKLIIHIYRVEKYNQ